MLQEQREEILKLFRRIYQKVSDAEGEAQFVFKDDNQKYLTHALIQSVLYNIEQQCVILFVEEHCLNDGTNATPMSLDSFKECMNTKQTNPMTRQYTMRETYNFYDCVTGTNAFNKTHLAEYRVQFDKAIELLSIDNPNLDALDIPQEVKDALRGLQFPIIKPYTLAEINAITEEESDNLNRLRLNDTNAVLESGKLWLIKLLSSEQIQALKPEQIQALTIEQIKALTTEQIKALRQKAELNSFEQVLNLSEENPYLIRLLTLQEIQALTRDQIQALQPYQIWALEFRQIKSLTQRQIKALETEQIKSLTEIQIKSLTQRQIQALETEQIKALTEIQIKSLTQRQIQVLEPVQIQALEPEQIKFLRENEVLNSLEQVLNLSEENPYLIKLLNLQEIQALTTDQIQVLDIWQIQALEPHQISALEPEQIQALEPEQIKALEPEQIQALKPEQIQALTIEQIQALTIEQIKALETEQIKALTEIQIKSLTQRQIKFLRENEVLNSLEQVLNLSEENPYLIKLLNLQEIQALTTDQIQVLDIWQIQALEPHQISALEPEQIQALEPEQIKALEPEQIKALKTEQIQALVTNILIQSYNSSIKTLESFQAKLGEYNNITINAEDAKKAFSAIHFVAKGQNFTEDHLKILQDKINWMQFIEQLVTYLFNCFRTEKQESIGGAKGKFQEMINKPKDKIQPQR